VPDTGTVTFEDRRYFPHSGNMLDRASRLQQLRSQIGMVFQRFNLYPHLTALQNVTLALTDVKKMPRKAAREKAEDRLAEVGLKDRMDHYPAQLPAPAFPLRRATSPISSGSRADVGSSKSISLGSMASGARDGHSLAAGRLKAGPDSDPYGLSARLRPAGSSAFSTCRPCGAFFLTSVRARVTFWSAVRCGYRLKRWKHHANLAAQLLQPRTALSSMFPEWGKVPPILESHRARVGPPRAGS